MRTEWCLSYCEAMCIAYKPIKQNVAHSNLYITTALCTSSCLFDLEMIEKFLLGIGVICYEQEVILNYIRFKINELAAGSSEFKSWSDLRLKMNEQNKLNFSKKSVIQYFLSS